MMTTTTTATSFLATLGLHSLQLWLLYLLFVLPLVLLLDYCTARRRRQSHTTIRKLSGSSGTELLPSRAASSMDSVNESSPSYNSTTVDTPADRKDGTYDRKLEFVLRQIID